MPSTPARTDGRPTKAEKSAALFAETEARREAARLRRERETEEYRAHRPAERVRPRFSEPVAVLIHVGVTGAQNVPLDNAMPEHLRRAFASCIRASRESS